MEDKRIPKVIHYIWFGSNEKSELIEKCIESWKKNLPDWKIIEWNESNYDISKSKYMKQAYDAKKYAFASDYARFDILYNYGGVYLDTDVELLKSIPEEFLTYEGFTGFESDKLIAPGLVFACKKKSKIVKKILDEYENEEFVINNKFNKKTVCEFATGVFEKNGLVLNGLKQSIDNFHVFSSDYFCAYEFDIKEFNILPHTISIHHYNFTWGSKRKKIVNKIKIKIKSLIGKNNYRKILRIKRCIFGVSK